MLRWWVANTCCYIIRLYNARSNGHTMTALQAGGRMNYPFIVLPAPHASQLRDGSPRDHATVYPQQQQAAGKLA